MVASHLAKDDLLLVAAGKSFHRLVEVAKLQAQPARRKCWCFSRAISICRLHPLLAFPPMGPRALCICTLRARRWPALASRSPLALRAAASTAWLRAVPNFVTSFNLSQTIAGASERALIVLPMTLLIIARETAGSLAGHSEGPD